MIDGSIMVTGALGFLGSALAERLVSSGCTVIGIDDGSSASPRSLGLIDRPGFTHIPIDLSTAAAERELASVASEFGISYVFHLACPASPLDYMRDPLRTLATCAKGTEAAISAALAANARLVFTSTSEVYGDPLVSPQPESYFGNVNPIGPRAVYDEGKRYAETLITAHGAINRLDYRIARVFNSYGPGMRLEDGRLLPSAISSLLVAEPVTVFGDGTQTRSMCFVEDTISGLLALAESDCEGPVNIGNDDERTVSEILEVVARAMGIDLRIRHLPPRQDDPLQRCPDLALARRALNWEAEVLLEDGVKRTIQALDHVPA